MIRREAIPDDALHARYTREGAYVDCFVAELDRQVTCAQFIEAFYTTWLFKLERWILARAVNKPSSDVQAHEIAHGRRADFAAWTQEARGDGQLLMCDFRGHTRSWLRVLPHPAGTRLFFGSVVTARGRDRGGQPKLTSGYRLLLGFHRLYSRALLAAARSRLRRAGPSRSA